MTKKEVSDFMEVIKAYYQNFSLEDYVVKEWYSKLKEFDYEDALEKLDEHLNGEYKNEIPKLHFLTKYLKTAEEKAKGQNMKVRCPYCDKVIEYDNDILDNHLARHSSVDYIKRKEYRIGKCLSEEKLVSASQEDFDRIYNKFLEELYVVSDNVLEKKMLERIIFTKPKKQED